MINRINSNTNFGEYQKTFMRVNSAIIADKKLPSIYQKLEQSGLKVHLAALDKKTQGVNLKIEGDEAISKLKGMENAFKNEYGDVYVSPSKQDADNDISAFFAEGYRGRASRR